MRHPGKRSVVARRRAGVVLAWALVALLLLAWPPTRAAADADPASDYLLLSPVFYPYAPPSAPALQTTLQRLVAELRARRVPLDVAIIGEPDDLGAVSNLFDMPQTYATFLESEISFNNHPALLVVMPNGFGVAGLGPARALAGLHVDATHGSNGLVRTAIFAVQRLAAADGKPLPAIAIPPVSTSVPHSGPTWLLFVAPAAIIVSLLVAGDVRARRRRNRRRQARERA